MKKGPFALFFFALMIMGISVTSVSGFGDRWVPRTPLPFKVEDFAAVQANGKIYAMGYNYTYENSTDTYTSANSTAAYKTFNYVYDTITDSWLSKTSMPTLQDGFALASYQNNIYVLGGSNSISTNQVYDITNDSWTTKASMPVPRISTQAHVIDGKIYLVGGRFQNGSSSSETDMYDPLADSWAGLAPIPIPTYWFGSVVVDGKIYVIGGGIGGLHGDALTSVQIYNPKTNTWNVSEPLPIPAGFASAAAMGTGLQTKIYVLGTSNEYFDMNSNQTMQIYNFQTNSWSVGTPIPAPTYVNLSIITENNTLYVLGGKYIMGVPGLYYPINIEYFPQGVESTLSPLPSLNPITPSTTGGIIYDSTPAATASPSINATIIPTTNPWASPSLQQSTLPQQTRTDSTLDYLIIAAIISAVLTGLVMTSMKRGRSSSSNSKDVRP